MTNELWSRYCRYTFSHPSSGFSIDISRVRFPDSFFPSMTSKAKSALEAMTALEKGAIANPDENRMVGHYWLRHSSLAPTVELRNEIDQTLASIKEFTRGIHSGNIRGTGGPFENLLVVGIGGSSLGPQFVSHALASGNDPIQTYFLDNTDPDGIHRTLQTLADSLDRTLVIVISKSGGTPETRNGMLLAREVFQGSDLNFSKHAVAITQQGSKLDQLAERDGWLARFPMWDWVGGRTSETSAVGLLPAAIQGVDIDELLAGAAQMDKLTREPIIESNPAALLALVWYFVGQGKGLKDMVILPYKDRLELFSRYLQQLVMESLGKELDRSGARVLQGIAVYGNKGSTDQHAYVQQLRDGLDNFFITFLQVLVDGGSTFEVEPNVTAGDYLSGFLQGTRQALYENGRDSITITIDEVRPATIGMLIALYERAVGLYAEMVNINAYHQPGVEAGKKAAGVILDLQQKILAALKAKSTLRRADTIAQEIGQPDHVEEVYHICRHLASNPGRGVVMQEASSPDEVRFGGSIPGR
ncbi:glucose-6-phosphate isomerase [bacterium]|nr:glucose-6-phosphate isomerase [bacterium]